MPAPITPWLGAPLTGVPPFPYSLVDMGFNLGGANTALLGSRATARCACGICGRGGGRIMGPRAISVAPSGRPAAAPTDCKEARKIAKRDGTAVPQNCLGHSHGGAHGGFGSTAAAMHGGG